MAARRECPSWPSIACCIPTSRTILRREKTARAHCHDLGPKIALGAAPAGLACPLQARKIAVGPAPAGLAPPRPVRARPGRLPELIDAGESSQVPTQRTTARGDFPRQALPDN